MYFVFKSNYINYLKSGKLNNNKDRDANQISGPGTGLCRDDPGPGPRGFPSDWNPAPAQPRSTHCEHWNTRLLPQGSLISTHWLFGSHPHTCSPSPRLGLPETAATWGERGSEGVCRAWVHGLLKHQIYISWAVTAPEDPWPSWPPPLGALPSLTLQLKGPCAATDGRASQDLVQPYTQRPSD